MDQNTFEILKEKIDNRSLKPAVLGVGYVGLPLMVEMAKAGFHVTGIDLDPEKIQAINSGRSYIGDVDAHDIETLREKGVIRATNDFSILEEIDAVSICVPTPLNKTKDPDVSYILNALKAISSFLHRGQMIILESTTYPGTTRQLLLPELSSNGMKVGEDFFLAFSPERVDPGNREFTIPNTPKVIGGITVRCTDICALFYSTFIERIIKVSSPEVAEMTKLLENTFRAVNIAMVNEVAVMCRKLGIDTWEVIEAASTKPFGFMTFYPGPGLGGHCLPVDPYYLSWILKSLNYHAKFIELAGEINSSMPSYIVDLIADILNEMGKCLKGAKVMCLGLSYKRNVADVRESPSIDIIHLLKEKRAEVFYSDPFIPSYQFKGFSLSSTELTEKNLRNMDIIVILTDHEEFDLELISKVAVPLLDTRNATGRANIRGKHIYKL